MRAPGPSTSSVTDSSSPALTVTQSYTIRVALDIATTALADATGGTSYSDGLVAQGGLPPLTWSLTAGTLPAGLSGPDPATGVISGTPDAVCAAATSSLTIQVTDSDTPTATDTQAGVDLTVNPRRSTSRRRRCRTAAIGAAYNQRVLATRRLAALCLRAYGRNPAEPALRFPRTAASPARRTRRRHRHFR